MVEIDPIAESLTKDVLGAAFEVSNVLGHGFLEVVYRKALLKEFLARGIPAEEEVRLPVRYKGDEISTYIADLVVGERVIVELKAITALIPAHTAQVLNYLRASGLSVALLLNFGNQRLEYKRVLAPREVKRNFYTNENE